MMSRQPMTTVSQKLQFSDGETRRKVQFLESEETCKTLKLMKVMQQNNVINFQAKLGIGEDGAQKYFVET